MLKIYGIRGSSNADKVEYTAILLGMKYEYQTVDIQKDSKTEWYLKIHPAGKVPAIDDDGFIMFESVAICKYLCDKKGGNKGVDIYPRDLKQRAIVDQWIDFTIQHVASAMGKIAYAKIFGPMMGKAVDENGMKEGDELLKRFLPIVDRKIGSKYLASDKFTLADVVLLASLTYADKCQYDLNPYENLTAWRQKLMEMDFYKKVHGK